MTLNFLNTLFTKEEIDFQVEEIKIKLPNGGHISGKWWGNKSIRPILCLHGWMDEAGTFDRLIPQLPKEFSYLAIDLPGHGKSSWNQKGIPYQKIDFLYMLKYLMEELKWNKISFIGHSIGGVLAFVFAALLPDKVDLIINIEGLKLRTPDVNSTVKELKYMIENFMIVDEKIHDKKREPPVYTIDEMVERVYHGTGKSVSRECAQYLLKRSIKASKKNSGKFYFTKDSRLRFMTGFNLPHSANIHFAKSIKIPYLFIQIKYIPSYESEKTYNEVLKILKESKKFEFLKVDSLSHHLHLTEPEKIVDTINRFIVKHRKLKNHL